MPEPSVPNVNIDTRSNSQKFEDAFRSLTKDGIDRVPAPVKLGAVAAALIGYHFFFGVGEASGAGGSPTPKAPEVTPNATQIVKTATKRAEAYTATPVSKISSTPIKTTEVVVPSKTPEPTTGNPPPPEPKPLENRNLWGAVVALGGTTLISLGLAGEWLRRRFGGKPAEEKKPATADIRGDRKREKIEEDFSDHTRPKTQ